MSRRRDERDEYVVECQVVGIAVLTVHADSQHEACATAELQVKASDVGELDEVHAVRVLRVGVDEEPVTVAGESSGPERPSTGSESDAES